MTSVIDMDNKGYAALGATLVLTMAGFVYFSVSQDTVRQANQLTERRLASDLREQANHSALDLASQLFGNTAILIDKNDQDKKRIIVASGNNLPDGSAAGWRVENGALIVSQCFQRRLSQGREAEIFRDNPSHDAQKEDWIKPAACGGQSFETTLTLVRSPVTQNKARGGTRKYFTHLEVRAATVDLSGTYEPLVKKALINIPFPTIQCNELTDDDLYGMDGFWGMPELDQKFRTEEARKICSLDHCRFMEPTRNGDGSIRYGADGKPMLRPNPVYKEDIEIPALMAKNYGVEPVNADDPQPVDVIEFYKKALLPGQLDPFLRQNRAEGKSQGIQGDKFNQSLVTSVTDEYGNEHVVLQSVSMPNDESGDVQAATVVVNPDLSDVGHLDIQSNGTTGVRFDGYLTGDSKDAIQWPAGKSFQDLENSLQQGCKRTLRVDDGTYDICSRMSFPFNRREYTYPQKRTCTYFGPANHTALSIPGVLPLSKHDWDPAAGNTKEKVSTTHSITYPATTWMQETSGLNEEQKTLLREMKTNGLQEHAVVAKSPGNYADRYPHESLSGLNLEQRAFTWNGTEGDPAVLNGTMELVYYRKVADAIVSSNESNQQNSEYRQLTYTRQRIEFTWQPNCEISSTDGDEGYHFRHDMAVCVYVVYDKVLDRNACSRSIHSRVCRNHNGCFTPDTMITMADMSEKKVSALAEGDAVHNPLTGKTAYVHKVVVGPERKPIYHFRVDGSDRVLSVTGNHPMATQRGTVPAEKVLKSDRLLHGERGYLPVAGIEAAAVPGGTDVWNLVLSDSPDAVAVSKSIKDHYVLANGMVTGDWYVQSLVFSDREYASFSEFMERKYGSLQLLGH